MNSSTSGSARRRLLNARMIHPLADRGYGYAGSFVQKTLSLQGLSGNETLTVSAFGLYRAFINGKRVGQDLLTPGWTNYDSRLAYQVYRVGDLLEVGENTVSIWLGDGWYRSPLMWTGTGLPNVWGDKVAAIAELRDEASGTLLLATDETWESGETSVRKSGIYFGEVFDARITTIASSGVAALPFDPAILIEQECRPVRELAPIVPVKSWKDTEARTIHDFGQNVGGYVAFSVSGGTGAQVIVEHAEILDEGGNFYNGNFRGAEARIEYTLSGEGDEHYRPMFTFQGFRYARVTVTGAGRVEAIQSVPITSVPDIAAGFSSANPLVNRLLQNTIWSQRGNFIEVPTDCPQRDERLGWTGDAQVFARTACYLADSQSFLAKFVREMMADQESDGAIAHFSPNPLRLAGDEHSYTAFSGSTGWGDAISIIPWALFLHYGDRSILEEAFVAMTKWNDYVWSIGDGPIVRPPSDWNTKGFTFGDWLQPHEIHPRKAASTIGDDAAATIYLYISSDQIARIAAILGRDLEAARFAGRAEAVKRAFAHEFITPAGRLLYDDQTSYALAFLHGLIPDEHLSAAKEHFKASIRRAHGRIGTGFIGTPALLPALVMIGEPEMAASVFLQEEAPGWLAQVKRGATTIWERWDAIRADGSIPDPSMNSYNHYAYGAVCQWLFESVAGFRPDPSSPGFRKVVFDPTVIPALSPVHAYHDTRSGRVAAGWAVDGEVATYTVAVPEGAEGELLLKSNYSDAMLDGRALVFADGAWQRCHLAPGEHIVQFRFHWRDVP